MKKECERTRKMLRRYSRGHVFAPERKRIEQHLRGCPLCATEYQSLKRVDETTQFLRDITPVEGVAESVRSGISRFSAARKILYRPLWMITAVAFLLAGYFYIWVPYQEQQEKEWRELTDQAVPAVSSSAGEPAPGKQSPEARKQKEPVATVPDETRKKEERPAPATPDPLRITVTVEDEPSAIRSINAVMRGHGELRSKQFSETDKTISGELTAKELLTFFDRISPYGKVSYSSRRFGEFPAAEPLPFTIRVRQAPRPVSPPPAAVQHEEAQVPAPAAGAAQPGPAAPASEAQRGTQASPDPASSTSAGQ